MAETTTVALIDDHQTLLDLMVFAITAEPDLAVAGTATTAAAGRELVERTRPDVVLLDLMLPDGDGIGLASLLSGRSRVVMLTASQDTGLISRAASVGVAGLVAKSGALDQVLTMIRTARAGAFTVDPALLSMLGPAPSGGLDGPSLTASEHAVLTLLSLGKDARAIARELSISLHTCRGYLKSILTKLDSHSQLEAVVKAGRLGLLSGA